MIWQVQIASFSTPSGLSDNILRMQYSSKQAAKNRAQTFIQHPSSYSFTPPTFLQSPFVHAINVHSLMLQKSRPKAA